MRTESGYLNSEHTPNHLDCPGCEAARGLILKPAELGELPFRQAAPRWLEEHARDISPRSLKEYQGYLRALNQFFGELPLTSIHIGHIEQYQKWRLEPRRDKNGRQWQAGPPLINHEVNALAQVMGRAGLWTEIGKFYKRLRQPRSRVGKALSDEEERKLFDTAAAAQNPYWKVAHWGMVLTRNTGAGENELLHLRLRDVLQEEKAIRIFEGVKNEYRERVLPLNDSAWWAMKRVLKRAEKCGVRKPDDYIFPHRSHGPGQKYDPTRPQGSWKHAWRSLRAAAGLNHVRMYDLRHSALTRIYEQPGVSDSTAEDIAGHNSAKMKKTYSHIRLETKRQALKAIEVRPGQQLGLDFGMGSPVLEFAVRAGKK